MNPFRILCVSNSLTQLHEMRNFLPNYGFEMSVALHGFDAKTQYNAHASVLGGIVIDNDTPNGEALSFAKHIRKLGYRGRIVVISSCMERPSLEGYDPLSVHDICPKPVQMGTLVTMLLQQAD